jgi:hypothetical protein
VFGQLLATSTNIASAPQQPAGTRCRLGTMRSSRAGRDGPVVLAGVLAALSIHVEIVVHIAWSHGHILDLTSLFRRSSEPRPVFPAGFPSTSTDTSWALQEDRISSGNTPLIGRLFGRFNLKWTFHSHLHPRREFQAPNRSPCQEDGSRTVGNALPEVKLPSQRTHVWCLGADSNYGVDSPTSSRDRMSNPDDTSAMFAEIRHNALAIVSIERLEWPTSN